MSAPRETLRSTRVPARGPLFSVGVASVDVTPPLTIPYLAHAPRHQFFRGVHDPLHAKALVVGDGERRVAVVTVDSIGIARRVAGPDRDFVDEVRRQVDKFCGLRPDAIMICATHAHSTPELAGFRPLQQYPGAASWLEALRDQLASVVAMAAKNVSPARLKIGRGLVAGLGATRRLLGKDGKLYQWRNRPPDDEVADWGLTDDEVVVLSFERPDGSPAAVLFHFPCHPTTVQVNPLVSADFPGVAVRLVEQITGCQAALFLQGACGATVPVRLTTDFADVDRYGHMLAGEVSKQVARLGAPDYPCEPVRVDSGLKRVTLPSRPLPDPGPVEARFAEAKRALADTDDSTRSQRLAAFQAAEETWERVRLGTGSFPAEVQVFRLGNLAAAAIPGEPFPQFGVAFKQEKAAPQGALCFGYANDYLGYIAPRDVWDQGGYEVSLGMWSWVGPEAYDLLLDETRQMIRRLFADTNEPGEGDT